MNRRLPAVVALMTAISLLATACTGATSTPVPTPAGAFKLDSAILAKAAPRPVGDDLAAAAVALAKAASGTGDAAVAALRTAMVMSGIDLADVGGKITDTGDVPKLGIQLPLGEVGAMVGTDTFDHGLTVQEIAKAIAPVITAKYKKKVDPTVLAETILTDTRQQEIGADYDIHPPMTGEFLSSFIAEVGRDAKPAVDFDTIGIDQRLTGLQTWLLIVGISGGLSQAATVLHSGAKKLNVGTGAYVHRTDGKGGCRPSDSEGKILDGWSTAAGAAATGVPMTNWSGVAGMFIPSGGEADPGKVFDGSDMVSWVNFLLAIAHTIAEGVSFHATLTMSPEPLVRTKSISSFGNDAKLTAHAEFKIPNGQWANCLRGAVNLGGVDGSVPNDGPIRDASVQWQLDDESSGAQDNPAVFSVGKTGAGFVESKTNDNGDATMTIQGNRQPDILPPKPSTFIRRVGVWASVQTQGSSLYADLTSAVSAVLGGAAAPAGIVTAIIDRMHSFGVHQTFQVQDWQKDFKIDSIVDLNAGKFNDAGQYPLVTGLKCGGLKGVWNVDVGGEPFSFTLDETGHGTTSSNGLGTVQVDYEAGPPSKIHFSNQYLTQSFTVVAGNFCKK